MIVQKRENTWALRVYTQDPGKDFKVAAEQYYNTRSEMRKGIKMWRIMTNGSPTKVLIKTYRVLSDFISSNHTNYDRVWYKQTR